MPFVRLGEAMGDISSFANRKRLCVFTELRLERTPDGVIRTPGPMPYSFWKRYLSGFDELVVVARVRDTEFSDLSVVEGEGVSVQSLPDRRGVRGNIKLVLPTIRLIARRDYDVALARIPSFIGVVAVGLSRLAGAKSAFEVVGDPQDVFAPGVVRHPLRPVLRAVLSVAQRFSCATANGVSYVTQFTLQNRYPAVRAKVEGWYSSVELPEDAFAKGAPVLSIEDMDRPILLASGYMDQRYKRFDMLIRVVAELAEDGFPVDLQLLGDGALQSELAELAEDLGILKQVHFLGFVTDRGEYRRVLGATDLFVHPSATEGLPRVVLEAMAVSRPVVATNAGGTAEVLPDSAIVGVDRPGELKSAILRSLLDVDLRKSWSAQNAATARKFVNTATKSRRDAFLRELASL